MTRDKVELLRTGVYFNPIIEEFLVLRRTRIANFIDMKTKTTSKAMCATIIYHDGVLYKDVKMGKHDSLTYIGTF